MALSVSDLLMKTVAEQARKHRSANSAWQEGGILAYDHVSVGFALNQSNGNLLVPVVHEADQMTLPELVGRIRRLQVLAVRQKLSPSDLAGGTVTITSLVGTGVHSVLPILVPDQSAIVAIGDRWEGFGVTAYCLTVGFDHRVMNGAEAAEFLVAVAQVMEIDDDE
jgi:pyruvate/2-oxoglutarate dehydrogenase complex dihydrolipoamide acyltransferase (E2) component